MLLRLPGRRHVRLAVTAGIIALLFSPLARASEQADESKILALENTWNQAQLHHNSTVVASMLPDTFIYTDYDGTVMNKTQFLADLMDTSYQATMVVNENVKVFTYEGAAIVLGTYHTKGKYKGRPIEHGGRFTDTWLFQNNLWQCVASHTSLIKK
jgi:hypothetical protein